MLFQLCGASQSIYAYFLRASTITITPNILPKPLAAVLHNHCPNEICQNDYQKYMEAGDANQKIPKSIFTNNTTERS